MVKEKSLLRIFLIVHGTYEPYLFRVTAEGDGKFQGVCVCDCVDFDIVGFDAV